MFLKKSEINFDTDILDIPGYFWENTKYEPHFQGCSRYLEIEQRTKILNKRLNIISVELTINTYLGTTKGVK